MISHYINSGQSFFNYPPSSGCAPRTPQLGEAQLCMIGRGAAMHDWARHSGAWLGEAQWCMIVRGAAVHDWARRSCAWLGEAQWCMPGQGAAMHDWTRHSCAWLGEAHWCMIGRGTVVHDWATRSSAWLGDKQPLYDLTQYYAYKQLKLLSMNICLYQQNNS